jgi:hypothetical protein
LGAKGGVSLGLYANGDLVYQGVVIAELSSGSKRSLEAATKANSGFSTTADQGEIEEDGNEDLTADGANLEPKCYSGHPFQLSDRPIGQCSYCYQTGTAWHCGFCNYNMCNKCYGTKMQELVDQAKEQKQAKAGNEEEPEDEEEREEEVEPESEPEPEPEPATETETEPEPEPEPESDKSPATEPEPSAKEGSGTPSPKQKKKRLQDLLPKERELEEKDLCSLFGRNSLVTLSLDTDKGGGTLSFEVGELQASCR